MADDPNIIVHYPNTTDTAYPKPTMQLPDAHYTCGPNTILNVLAAPHYGAVLLLINSGSMVNLYAPLPPPYGNHFAWVKSGAVLNIMKGGGPVNITFEPGAIINNPYNIPTSTHTCSSLNFPVVNCAPTWVVNSDWDKSFFQVFPNPASNQLMVSLETNEFEKEFVKAEILNSIGQKIREVDLIFSDKKAVIEVKELQPGAYVLLIRGTNSNTIKKRIIIH